MNTYIGTKVVRAVAMTRAAYNALRGWTVPADENGADEGYLVEYLDGGAPNLAGYTPIHLLVPLLFAGLLVAFGRLARRDIAGHRRAMRTTYVGACLMAGAFTLLPNRYLGGLLWHGVLGL